MRIPIYQADAFTDKLFGGNPAAICPLDEWLPDETMQQIAVENNLAETAFFVKNDTGYKLRWFTPEYEMDLCGHATLASAHILFTELGYEGKEIHFETVKAGTLAVKKDGDKYAMDFPSRPPILIDPPVGLIEALGEKQPLEVLRSRDYFLVYETEEDIREISPDFFALSKIGYRWCNCDCPREERRLCVALFCAGRRDTRRSGYGLSTLQPDPLLGRKTG